jgi:hypothetical protein
LFKKPTNLFVAHFETKALPVKVGPEFNAIAEALEFRRPRDFAHPKFADLVFDFLTDSILKSVYSVKLHFQWVRPAILGGLLVDSVELFKEHQLLQAPTDLGTVLFNEFSHRMVAGI